MKQRKTEKSMRRVIESKKGREREMETAAKPKLSCWGLCDVIIINIIYYQLSSIGKQTVHNVQRILLVFSIAQYTKAKFHRKDN